MTLATMALGRGKFLTKSKTYSVPPVTTITPVLISPRAMCSGMRARMAGMFSFGSGLSSEGDGNGIAQFRGWIVNEIVGKTGSIEDAFQLANRIADLAKVVPRSGSNPTHATKAQGFAVQSKDRI